MNAFVFGARLDADIDAGLVRLGDDLDICRAVPSGSLAVGANVISAGGNPVEVRDLLQQAELNFIELFHASPSFVS